MGRPEVYIHPSAAVHPKAQLDSGVWVGPYSVVGEKVTIHKNTRLMANVFIDGRTEIGSSCLFFPFSVIGTDPQDVGYKEEETLVKIGDRNKFREFPDGFLMGFAHDPMTTDSATYLIYSRKWVDTLGGVFPLYFPHWFPDTWVDHVARMAGRHAKLPIVMYPIRGKGRTKLMRNLPFWTRFFQLTLPEREEAARKLIATINPTDKAAALATLRQVADQLRKDGDRFSDVYCAFQEERHAELDVDERAQFNPKYFKHEAAAVARLIEMARELIAQKKFAEAMECLDATQLSDLRVKQAQVLKSECLRSLGKSAEADQVLKESLAAWPQMTTLRKCFRFLGMVANDGKRLWVGMTEKRHSGAK